MTGANGAAAPSFAEIQAERRENILRTLANGGKSRHAQIAHKCLRCEHEA